jgi:hypothetical protein
LHAVVSDVDDEIDTFLSTYGFDKVHTTMTGFGWGGGDAFYIRNIQKMI